MTLPNAILDRILRNVSFTTAPVYLSLHTADPGENGSDEISGGSYARAQVGTDGWTMATSGFSTNVGTISFPENDVDQVTITHIGAWDAASGGNFLRGGPLVSALVLDPGQTLSFSAGKIVWRESSPGVQILDIDAGELDLDNSGNEITVVVNMMRLAVVGKLGILSFDLQISTATGTATPAIGLPTWMPQIFEGPGGASHFSIGRFGDSLGHELRVSVGGNYSGGRNVMSMTAVNKTTGAEIDFSTDDENPDLVRGQISFTAI